MYPWKRAAISLDLQDSSWIIVHYLPLFVCATSIRILVFLLHEQVMSGMEKQIADFSSREESTSALAKESKQKVQSPRRAGGA